MSQKELEISLNELAREKQIYEIEQQKENIKCIRKRKQSVRAVAAKNIKKIKAASKDKVFVPRLKGSLGENLLRLGQNIMITNNKAKYFGYLSKNSILDMSVTTPCSQISQLGGSIFSKYMNERYIWKSNSKIRELDFVDTLEMRLKNITGKLTALRSLELIDKETLRSYDQRIIKNIYTTILESHVYKSYIFSDIYIKECSEMSIIIKYWGNLFESFFGSNNKIFLQWGDTVSPKCKNSNLNFKLDLRIIIKSEGGPLDASNGEFAKVTAATSSKYYYDKSKAVLTAKCHLNAVIINLKIIPRDTIKDIRIPIIQIMGLNCHIYCLSLIDKNLYIIQKVKEINIPRMYRDISSAGIKKTIEGLSLIEEMVENISDLYNDYNISTLNIITNIDKGKSKANNHIDNEDWISPVIWDGNDEQEDEEDEDGEKGNDEEDDSDNEDDEEDEKEKDEEKEYSEDEKLSEEEEQSENEDESEEEK